MAISKDLFLSILAMDSYNHGYDEGIENLGGVGADVGYVKILQQSKITVGSPERDAGFYAVAYELTEAVGDMAAGTVIISYRGTDAPWTELLGTVAPIIAGDYDEDQIYLANQFYNSVKDANPNAPYLTE